MTRQNSTILAFNRGIVSNLGSARMDVPRMRIGARTMRNWMARVLGSMMLRPGTEYIETTKSSLFARTIPFVRSVDVYARIELTNQVLRVLVDDELVTRATVTAAVTNGTFTSNIVGWTDADEGGAASTHHASGYAQLLGDGTNFAILRQQVTVNEASTRHALRVVVARGPVMFRVGSTSAGEEYIGETALGTGTHSLAFTPSGNFHIQISSSLSYAVLVDSIAVEAAGVMELPTPWTADDLPQIRHTTSADVIYVVDGAHQQRMIERRAADSWSVVLYEPVDGPFRVQNVSNTTLTASGLSGSVTLTASKGMFRSGHVGALFRVASQGQQVFEEITVEDTFTDPIRVAGVGASRVFGLIVSGTFVGTATLQYSVGEPGSWIDLATYSTFTSTSYDDGQDNQVIYYRLGVKTGDYSSGTVGCFLSYASGSITGIARITAYSSPTSVSAVVLQDLGSTDATPDWWEGEWSDYRGWPTAVTLFEGRLWPAGGRIWGSISDAYESFDDTFEGDAGPISRSIGEGPIETIHWLLPLGRILFGTALNSSNVPAVKIDGKSLLAAMSSSFDDPLTPTNFNIKTSAVRGAFVDRSGQRLLEIGFNANGTELATEDLTVLVPDLNNAGIAGIAVQTTPDVRLHCWRNDGTVGVLVFDRAENVICWIEIETDGEVEDVSVLPGADEDQVYYIVKRTINGSDVRYHEKMALESECTGRPMARVSDCHLMYSGVATQTIGGLSHLEGETVVVWGWNTGTPFTDSDGNAVGRDLGTFVVSSAQITGLPASVTNACIGLQYVAEFESVKPAIGDAAGSQLNQRNKIQQLGLILHNTHYQGLRYGQSLDDDEMFDLPRAERFTPTDTNRVWDERETGMFPLGGNWNTDSRLCLRAASPRPCTVLAASLTTESNAKG